MDLCLNLLWCGITRLNNQWGKIHIKRLFIIIKEKCTKNANTDINVLAASSLYAIFNAKYSPTLSDSEVFMYVCFE